jgi:hypothetical protein
MDRNPPRPESDEITLYVNTYYSLLRSSGEVRVRAFEEAHAFSHSALHPGALSEEPDLSAFAYAAARLPEDMIDMHLVVLGQSHELFEAVGYDVQDWTIVKTRGRRRPLRYDGAGTLAVFIASASDIDDLVPILTAWQIEWNKMHLRLRTAGTDQSEAEPASRDDARVATLLGIDEEEAKKLRDAFGGEAALRRGLEALATRPMDLKVRMLAPSHSQYQRAAQRWWSGVEPVYVQPTSKRAPVYFVSSNTHAIANLVGGYAQTQSDAIVAWAKDTDPEGLGDDVARAAESGDAEALAPLLYYLLRAFIHASPKGERMKEVRAFEASHGLVHLAEPGHIDVDAQIARLADIDPAQLDPRLRVPGIEALRKSDAVLLNIDYPLGMAAYHLLSRVGQGVGDLRGVYVMGKAATLNGRVGDVMLSGTVYDEHSRNTFLFRNAFAAQDVQPFLRHGSVFDNQKAVTVRSAFLQNKEYMAAFYRSGYTVLEMEAGPFLGAAYELVNPRRVPTDEVIHLSARAGFDVGIVHYASDTPYSRRQSLLSKSLSYFGVDSTYACATAIVRRILELEVERHSG